MDATQRAALASMGWQIHGAVEEAYLAHPAARGESALGAEWLEKQRLLLADMAIHLLQTAIKPGDIAPDQLRNNLHAILTIADQFLPEAQLKAASDRLWTQAPGEIEV
jgi:hypothetical protein